MINLTGAAFSLFAAAAGSTGGAANAASAGWLGWLEGTLAFFLVLGVLVLVHEFGHFIAAKLIGVRVDEFAFGFGPKLVRLFKRGDTEYTIHPFPMGGFVKLAGMEPDDPETPDGFNSKPVLHRMIVILAGPLMNMVLALFIFCMMGFTVGSPVPGVIVKRVIPHSEAARVGLQPGDVINSVDGKSILMPAEAVALIRKNPGREITIQVKRGDNQLQYRVTPRLATAKDLANPTPEAIAELKKAKIGLIGFEARQDPLFKRTSVGTSISNGVTYTYVTTMTMVKTIFGPVVGTVPLAEVKKDVGGPIAIFFVVKGSLERGIAMLLLLVALLSVNLGVVNVLPIPVLDGGHLALLTVEAIRRKKLSPEKQAAIQMVGLSIILMLMIVLFYNDISRISDYLGK